MTQTSYGDALRGTFRYGLGVHCVAGSVPQALNVSVSTPAAPDMVPVSVSLPDLILSGVVVQVGSKASGTGVSSAMFQFSVGHAF